jgi:oligoendopeptidase F
MKIKKPGNPRYDAASWRLNSKGKNYDDYLEDALKRNQIDKDTAKQFKGSTKKKTRSVEGIISSKPLNGNPFKNKLL